MSDRKPHASEKTCKWQVLIHGDMLNLTECTSFEALGSARRALMSKKESSSASETAQSAHSGVFKGLILKVVVGNNCATTLRKEDLLFVFCS